ncbi:MAG TPA: FAD/NAD(P)-binding oxidoreductase [bacterium]|nr:FAD/NAD(P)-binding oxidoreductase [bacterium]
MKRVLIVGGGSGATMLANMLDRRRFEVIVLSKSPEHMFQPALLYVAFKNATPNIIRDERRLLPRHVRFIQEPVSRIDLAGHRVTTEAGTWYDYDSIVVATGVRADPSQIPGLAEVNEQFGNYHSTVAWAQKVWANLDAFRGGTIVLGQTSPVIKCPPSPVEGMLLTEELLHRRGLRDRTRLVFISPYPRAYPAEPMNAIVEPILRSRGVEIMPFFDVDRIDPAARTIYSIEGDEVQYDLPILIPPFVGADIAYGPADVVDANRFVVTDKHTLRIKGFDNAFAIGDATNLPTSKAGVGAHLEAKVVAALLSGAPARFNGRTHCAVDLAYGEGTFVIGSYTAPVQHVPPTRLSRMMKMMMAHMYWLSLRGWLEPMFDWYFARTDPDKRRHTEAAGSQARPAA